MIPGFAYVMAGSGLVIVVAQVLFIALHAPNWKVVRRWWINTALYAQATALACLGAALIVIWGPRLGVASALPLQGQVGLVFLALVAALASIVFATGYLLNREWGAPLRARRARRRGR